MEGLIGNQKGVPGHATFEVEHRSLALTKGQAFTAKDKSVQGPRPRSKHRKSGGQRSYQNGDLQMSGRRKSNPNLYEGHHRPGYGSPETDEQKQAGTRRDAILRHCFQPTGNVEQPENSLVNHHKAANQPQQ
ncbi:MAG TPA: hypothetical protein VK604_15155 [Bryobacteraceae bacterium]|nr:hypothetical protein [Bryobacteraceae bacterium]